MTAPVRLHLSRRRGYDLQAASYATNERAAINVARPGPWGNPFVVGVDGTRAECVLKFALMLDRTFFLTSKVKSHAQQIYCEAVSASIDALRGRNLACWCHLPAPGEPDQCHAAVLLAWVNNDTMQARAEALKPILSPTFERLREVRATTTGKAETSQ